MYTKWKNDKYITSWDQFNDSFRTKERKLLSRLDDFPNSVLVTGCQRSGTTIISRILTESDGMEIYWFSPDDELDAALILSGYVQHTPKGRYCFQTTFINDHYQEYFSHKNGHKIIWLLRNPYSVVNSMLNNWSNKGIDRLFLFCGVDELSGIEKLLVTNFGFGMVLSRVRKACLAYRGKTNTLFEIAKHLGTDELVIVDYDDLVLNKQKILPNLYKFIDLEYKPEYAEKIHARSLNKSRALPRNVKHNIQNICDPIYIKAKELAVKFSVDKI